MAVAFNNSVVISKLLSFVIQLNEAALSEDDLGTLSDDLATTFAESTPNAEGIIAGLTPRVCAIK